MAMTWFWQSIAIGTPVVFDHRVHKGNAKNIVAVNDGFISMKDNMRIFKN